jgi:hypothetical protein
MLLRIRCERLMLFGYAARFVHGLPVSVLLVVTPCTNTDSGRATLKRKPKGISISLKSSIPRTL